MIGTKAGDMSVAFWDSSALVPLCALQGNSAQVLRLADEHKAFTWWASYVEIHSAIARLFRLGEIDQAKMTNAINRLDDLAQRWKEILPSDDVRDEARNLLYSYPLRAADSFQLAAAMIWCRKKPQGRTFICSHSRLSEAAAQAGFTIVTP